MRQGLQLRISQHLALTPQLQQSIRLLQLSTLELNAEIDQALQSKDITLHGDGLQSRTLTYVEDLVDGCIAVLEYLSESLNQVINLSTEESISAVQMASDILRETKSSSVIVKIDQRKNQTIHEDISLEKAKKLLRFKAQTKWIDGLRKVINYQKNKYEK